MSFISLICSIQFSFCFFLGFYVLSRDTKSPENRLFFLMNLAVSLWFIPSIYLYSSSDPVAASEYIKYASLGVILFVPAVLHFTLLISHEKNLKIYYLVYIPFILIAGINLHSPLFFSRIYKIDGCWHFVPNLESLTYRIYSFLAVGCIICAIIILFRKYFQITFKRKKKQLQIVAVSLLLWIAIITAEEVLLPLLITNFTYGLAPITFIIVIFGMAWSILRYGFLERPISLAGYDIINNVQESIIILDSNICINEINRRSLEILNSDSETMLGKNFIETIDRGDEILPNIKSLLHGDRNYFETRFRFLTDKNGLLINAGFYPVMDKLGDSVGILMIARETGNNEFTKKFSITKREMEIILKILSGLTNRKIAEKFSISELTVKSHITNIYQKLDITNRIQLLEILKQFDVAP